MPVLRNSHRRGAIAPLTAALLIPMLAMLAFAIDLGWITHTHTQLQAAADAAALAGADYLADDYVRFYLPGQSDSRKADLLNNLAGKVKTAAVTYARYNRAGDTAALTLLDSDIAIGFTDEAGKFTAMSTRGNYPNTVTVVLRRDASANGPLGLFFARVLGVRTVNLRATASASIYAGRIDGFQTDTDIKSRILPMTYDVNHWTEFLLTGKDPDGKINRDKNGDAQLSIYPSVKYKGNFGELSLDQGNNGASVISNWIEEGVTSRELQALESARLLPFSERPSNPQPDWKGNPGLKTSTIQTVGDNVGEVYLLPLYKPVNPGNPGNGNNYSAGSGAGSNYYYNIVQFVGIKITEVDATGNDKAIMVQPTSLIDPNAIYSEIKPASPPSASNPLATTIIGAKLIN